MKTRSLILSTAIIFSVNIALYSQEIESHSYKNYNTKYGIGGQFTTPVFGVSGMMDINENISAQAIIGFLGDLFMIGGKGLYKFNKDEYWNIYGYGLIGPSWYTTDKYNSTARTYEEITEFNIMFGGGAGFEYNWKALSESLPDLFWNIELGFGILSFDETDYDISGITFGAGVHYRF